jgi:large subunit ribosomal protein L6
MSRIGNKPITIPEGVEVTLNDKNLTVKGPKGTLNKEIHKNVNVTIEGNVITVSRLDDEPANRSLHGLTRTLINNMIIGVKEEFKRELEINGVGYRANVVGDFLILGLGYSHDIAVFIPKELKISIGKPNLIIIEVSDKELVGKMASSIISLRKTEPYKGKGIKKVGQYVVRKEGKKK